LIILQDYFKWFLVPKPELGNLSEWQAWWQSPKYSGIPWCVISSMDGFFVVIKQALVNESESACPQFHLLELALMPAKAGTTNVRYYSII